ncbi:MAG: hypothetical protein K0R50_2972 [Eubacterium sp.]|jgi:NitT/TauT family transport system substrate-binding protein|nr:hypothetical protein [Eubacterium sp.]
MLNNFKLKNAVCLITGLLCVLLLSACGSNSAFLNEKYSGDKSDPDNDTVRIGYFGQIYESPLLAAYEQGYFKKSGINVEMIKINDKDIKNEYIAEKLDAVTADYRFFKYIEEGLPVKVTAGLNAGCIRIIVPNDSKITGLNQLKDVKMGVEDLGDGTMVLTSMLLKGNRLDTGSGFSWKPYRSDGYIKAFENGVIDAACIWEPSEKDSVILNNEFRTLYTNINTEASGTKSSGHNHGSALHFTRTFTGISAGLVDENPEKAIFITKAWLQGAGWVSENNEAAAKLLTEKKYVPGSQDENLNALASYMWTIGVASAKPNIKYLVKEQKKNGILKENLNEADFFKKVFAGVMPEFY